MKYDTNNNLWLTWKEPTTRERFVIGLLTYKEKKYYFEYLKNEGKNNLNEAIKKGFKLLPAFPENKKYESDNLFYTFINRLPNRKRKDVQELIKERNLNEDCSDFELLREIGGALPTDTFEFLIPISFVEIRELNLSFYVAGTKYYEDNYAIETLKEKTELELKIDFHNKYDEKAIEIVKDNCRLGYIPRCYCEYIYEYVKKDEVKAELEKIYKNQNDERTLKVRIFGLK